MSTYTDKIGYIVRFGGPEGIQWIKTGDIDGRLSRFNAVGAANPVGALIEATKAAGLMLQWWEMRKQTLLQTAQLEERRIPWLADMLYQWSNEARDGNIRLDTVIYLEREISRLMDKITETKQLDLPSSLLLQVERSASGMSAINSLLCSRLKEHQHYFMTPGNDLPRLIEYQSFRTLEGSDKQIEGYLERIDRTLGVLKTAMRGAAGFITSAPLRIASWHSARIAAEKKHRLEEFYSLTAMAIELRSLRTQLAFLTLLPPIDEFLEMPPLAATNLLAAGSNLEE